MADLRDKHPAEWTVNDMVRVAEALRGQTAGGGDTAAPWITYFFDRMYPLWEHALTCEEMRSNLHQVVANVFLSGVQTGAFAVNNGFPVNTPATGHRSRRAPCRWTCQTCFVRRWSTGPSTSRATATGGANADH